ncbi:LysM peptidoglycan-binding domain-containing protein [Micromonospora echinaurantiaca]|uniref:LysM peptidoglycan-binding domain-containing protein n=1 Tax=Micromonospora echinaurantiaca TaxID=47857 RepID=UPI0037951CE3
MAASGRSVARRTGRVLTGFAALVVLCAVLVGGPVALLALAANPLPDHVPTVAEIGATLTSRDDGRLFLRALALAGWFGWATFALSVLVELGAQALRRPAPRLPGMSRQQRAAAALVGSVALIVATAPAASAATATMQPYAQPAAPTAVAPATVAPAAVPPSTDVPVYRVAKGDYLGAVAERYLGEFADYRELARLNRLDDPDRIRAGQLLKLPAQASDRGARTHATGRLVARAARPAPPGHAVPGRTAPEQPDPGRAAAGQQPPGPTTPGRVTQGKAGSGQAAHGSAESTQKRPDAAPPEAQAPGGAPVTVGAARAGEADRMNRPLAVAAVLTVASIVGAQIGAVLGLRRRPATARAGGARASGDAGRGQAGAHASAAGELPAGRHRRD